MMKVVLKLQLRDGDEKSKQKAMIIASGLSGVDSVAMDMKDKKLTITGNVDPVKVVGKLRKVCGTEIVTVGPAKQEDNKKKDDVAGAKKDDKPQQQQPQSKDQKKPDDQKTKAAGEQNAAVKVLPQQIPQYYYQYQNYPPQMIQQQPYQMNYYPNNYNHRYPEHADQSDTCVIS